MGNDIAISDNNNNNDTINSFSGNVGRMFTTIKGEDFSAKLALNNAIADAEPIDKYLDKWINLKDVIVQDVEFTDEDESTGDVTVTSAVMVVLVDDQGKAYRVFSNGVFRDLQRLLNILGDPNTWPDPVSVKVVQTVSGKNRFYNLRASLTSLIK